MELGVGEHRDPAVPRFVQPPGCCKAAASGAGWFFKTRFIFCHL